jgi:hypothetical protein
MIRVVLFILSLAVMTLASNDNKLTTMVNRPWDSEKILQANMPDFVSIIASASLVGDVLQDYTVLIRINQFIVDPSPTDPNFPEMVRMINLQKTGGLLTYLVISTVKTQIGSPLPTPRSAIVILTEPERIRAVYLKACPSASKRDADRFVRETLETIQRVS